MKIIQFLGELDEHGTGRYIIELNEALKMAGHDVELVYFENDFDKTKKFVQRIPNVTYMQYGQELFDKLNSADIIMLNILIHINAPEQSRKEYYDTVINKINGPKIVAFNNEHGTPRYKVFVNEFTGEDQHDLLRKIDKFVTFSPFNKLYKKIEKEYPEISKKYIHMQHPYRFTNQSIADFDNKYRRVTYMGRFAAFKDPSYIVRHKAEFEKNNYQLEMRGMVRTFTLAFTPGMVYDFHEDGTRTPTNNTLDLMTKKAITTRYPGEPLDLIHFNDRDLSKVYLFGRYNREEGMEAMKHSQFGCNFIYFKNHFAFGDNVEYTVAEMVDMGTIPLLNYEIMSNCRLYDKDGNMTNKKATDYSCGICFKRDGSNISEAIDQMNKLSSDKEAYDKYRKECLEFYKELFDPVKVANKLIKDILNDDNTQSLADFGL